MTTVKKSVKKVRRQLNGNEQGFKHPLTATLRNLEKFHGRKAVLDAIKEFRHE